MLVNYIQIAYILGISTKEAKFKMLPLLNEKCIKSISSKCFVESSDLKEVFRHPSAMLDGKDKIAYIIESLQRGVDINLAKKVVEDMTCLKNGKISGKYRPLLSILKEEDIKKINDIIKRRREAFLLSGGKFPTRKKQ